jgi:hypothetical protein
MYEQEIAQLRAWATSNDQAKITRYRAVCAQRDAVLIQAVKAMAQQLMAAGGYQLNPAHQPLENYEGALDAIENQLSQSSVPVDDQRILALIGVGALDGWKVQLQDDEHDLRVYQSGTSGIDPIVAHRIGRSLDRSPDQEQALWQQVEIAAQTAAQNSDAEPALFLASVRLLLDEIPMNELDDAVGTMVLDSILGG